MQLLYKTSNPKRHVTRKTRGRYCSRFLRTRWQAAWEAPHLRGMAYFGNAGTDPRASGEVIQEKTEPAEHRHTK